MRNIITRNVNFYKYITGNVDIASNTISDVHEHVYTYRLGVRERRKLEVTTGSPIIREVEEHVPYGISIDDFIKYGYPIVDTNEEVNET